MSVLALSLAKTHLNLTGTTHDTELQTFIDAAEATIGRLIGPLEVEEYTERVRGRRSMLELAKLPVVEIVSVTPDPGSALDLDSVQFDPAGVIELASGYGRFASANYTVVYRAGWQDLPDTALPADILLAVKELVRHLWETQRGSGAGRPGSRSSDAVANTVPGAAYALPIRVEQLLSPYVPLASA